MDWDTPPLVPDFFIGVYPETVQHRMAAREQQFRLNVDIPIVQVVPSLPMPYPVALTPDNQIDKSFLDATPYYPAGATNQYGEVSPFLYPQRRLHQILNIG